LNEEIASQILQSAPMAEAKSQVFDSHFKPRMKGLREGAFTEATSALEEMAFSAMLDAAEQDPLAPGITWFLAPPLRLADVDLPGSRFAFDNPDRTYRFFAIDSAYSYVVRGQINEGKAPGGLIFEALAQNDRPVGWSRPHAALMNSEMLFNDDGSFEVLISQAPSPNYRNHLRVGADTHHVLIRDTTYDWSNEEPTLLKVERLDGPEARAKDVAALQGRAVNIFRSYAAMQFAWTDTAIPEDGNTVLTPVIRATHKNMTPWGMTAGGAFHIDEDEALILTLDPQGAKYLGVMLSAPWFLSIDYRTRFSSLNNHQTDLNPDGTITYVLSASDPGVKNWLETGDARKGTMLIRWEHFKTDPDVDTAVRELRKVRLAEIPAMLPQMARLTPEARELERRKRSDAVDRRFRLLRGCTE
jgi:hypothetical protein